MGVPGLTKFIQECFRGWERRELKGKLVIDACNFFFYLNKFKDIPWKYGGQYACIRKETQCFVEKLKKAGVDPVFVFHGIDYEGKKTSAVRRGRKKSIATIHKSLYENHRVCSQNVLPIFAFEVYLEALRQCQVEFHVADGEADPEAVALANRYSCPVLSNDSDYYLFNVEAGYVPLSSFEWESGGPVSPVVGHVYLLSNFAKYFDVPVELCHALPVFLGNDFIKSPLLGNQGIKADINRLVLHSFTSRAETVVAYLSKFSSFDDLHDRLASLPSNGAHLAHRLSDKFEQSKEKYIIKTSEAELCTSTSLRFQDGAEFPEWLICQHKEGYFSPSLMEVAVLGKTILRVLPDDLKEDTSMTASRPIRQAIYGILKIAPSSLIASTSITETIRHQLGLHDDLVDALPAIGDFKLPSIAEVKTLTPQIQLDIFCAVLEIDATLLQQFEKRWWLVVAVTCYWVKVASPRLNIIKALVLCLFDEERSHKLYRCDTNLSVLHKCAQWQCICLDAMKLNNLLMNPLLFLSLADLFDGNFIVCYAKRKDIDSIASKVLGRRNALYSALLAVVCPDRHAVAGRSGKAKSTRPAKTAPSSTKPVPPAPLLTNRFAALAIGGDSDSDGSTSSAKCD